VCNRAAWVALALCASLAVQQARAESVLLNDTSLVTGSQSAVFSFEAPGPGVVVAQVVNIDWPQALSSLSFAAGSASKVMSSWSDTGSQGSATLSFSVSGPGMYFADIQATAGGPLDLGVYSMCIKFTSAVPLPSPVWLLAAGLVALLAGRRLLRPTRPAAIPACYGA